MRNSSFILFGFLMMAANTQGVQGPCDVLSKLETRSSPLRQTESGRFVPISEISQRYSSSIDNAYNEYLSKPRATKVGTPERLAEEEKLFREALAETLPGSQFRVLDTPLGWTVPGADGKRVPLPIHLARVLTFDHHGPFLNYAKTDPGNNEKRNSTKQLLDYIGREVNGLSGNALESKIAELKSTLSEVSTDNLGDGALAVWISQNLPRVAKDPKLRAEIAQLTFFEDFGFFGTKMESIASSTENPKLALAIDRTKALFDAYDRILKQAKEASPDPKLGVNTSDRFGQLEKEQQVKIMEAAVAAVDQVLGQTPAQTAIAAQRFESAVTRALQEVKKQSQRAQKDAADYLVENDATITPETAAKRVAEFSRNTFITYGLDPNAAEAGGRFATWGANPRAHDKPNHVEFTVRPDGKTNFVFGHPHGRSFTPWFKGAVDTIKKIHLERLKASGASPESLAKAEFDVAGRPGPSDFFFSFNGVLLSPGEITRILMQSRETPVP